MQKPTYFKTIFVAILAFSFSLSSCKKQAETKIENGTENKSETVTTTNQGKEIIAVYQSCAVYAGSTQYFFISEKGDSILFSVLNKALADGETFIAKVPDNLIDDDPNIEGVPGENPKMVGKKFKIIYNSTGEVIEVKAN